MRSAMITGRQIRIWMVGFGVALVLASGGQLAAAGTRATALTAGGLASVSAFQVAGLFEYNFGDAEVIAPVLFVTAIAIGSAVGAGLGRCRPFAAGSHSLVQFFFENQA